MQQTVRQRDWFILVMLSIFGGMFGLDRFYLGQTFWGILKLLTAGGFGIWALIDSILILANELHDVNGNLPFKKQPSEEELASGTISKRDWLTALLYSIFLGALGVDRFYLGYRGLGIFKLGLFLILIFSEFIGIALFGSKMAGFAGTYIPDDVLWDAFIKYLLLPLILGFVSGVWWLVDMIRVIMNKMPDVEGKRLWKSN